MDKTTAVSRVRQFADAVRSRMPVKRIVLFGSYARGTQTERSDIDVAVVVESIGGDVLEAQTGLYRLRRDIEARIEPVLLEEGNDRSGFLAEVIRTGETIYQST